MFAIKALITLLPFYLILTAAMPQYPTPTTADKASNWGVNATDGAVTVNFYEDKNPDHSTPIDPNTCQGQAEIALMHWRSNCKSLAAVWRYKDCWNHAPSQSRCCPMPKKKSCIKYWPEKGEWEQCLRWRKECGPDCHWQDLTNSVQWCWKYAPDM